MEDKKDFEVRVTRVYITVADTEEEAIAKVIAREDQVYKDHVEVTAEWKE